MQDGDADLRELLHMLQAEESCSDEEGDPDHSRLMELAAAVASQPNAHARLSQALSQIVRSCHLSLFCLWGQLHKFIVDKFLIEHALPTRMVCLVLCM